MAAGGTITKHDIVNLDSLESVTKAIEALAPSPGIEARVKALEDARDDPPPNHAASHEKGGNDPVVAPSALKWHSPVSCKVNLGSTDAVNVDGSTAIKPGVGGILPIANGGTGATTAAAARAALGISNTAGAPMPTSETGLGRWRLYTSSESGDAVLPAGGTWAYFLTGYNTHDYYAGGHNTAGVAAGGSTVATGAERVIYTGLVWKIL